jgi:hypothetical protein
VTGRGDNAAGFTVFHGGLPAGVPALAPYCLFTSSVVTPTDARPARRQARALEDSVGEVGGKARRARRAARRHGEGRQGRAGVAGGAMTVTGRRGARAMRRVPGARSGGWTWGRVAARSVIDISRVLVGFS